MINRRFGAVLGAALSLALAGFPARADYIVKDGNGAFQTMKSFDVTVLGVSIHQPGHVLMGLSGGVPFGVNMTTPGALDVTVVGGVAGGGPVTAISSAFVDGWNLTLGAKGDTAWDGAAGSPTQMAVAKYAGLKTEAIRALLASTLQDTRPASSTITALDAGTSTVTGQAGVILVTGTPTANSFQTQALNGASSANIITTGTFVGTLQIEGSPDGGATYVPISGLLRGASVTTATITGPSVVSAEVAGFTHVRVRAIAYTSGTPTVQMTFSAAPGPVKVTNPQRQMDSAGGDATDTVNHAVKVNVVAGGSTPSPWTPSGQAAQSLSATTTSSSVTLTSPGPVVVVINDGLSPAFVRVGAGTPTAVVGDTRVLPGGYATFASAAAVAGITSSGTATLRIETGTGVYQSGLSVDASKASTVNFDHSTPGSTDQVVANLAPTATGGCTPGGAITTASTNAAFIKASAGTLCGGLAINTTATMAYLRWYNLTAAPTCSSATGYVMTTPIPANATGAGTVLNMGTFGAAFSTGIAYCVTGGGSSTDNTNAVAGVYINYTTK